MNRRNRFFSRRKRMMEDLDQDIRDFIERETQDNIERGMPPEEARYAALRKFGNVTRVREDTREVWTTVWFEQLWQDIRYALRMLVKNPGFTAVAALTLALGIGANTAIFTLIDAVMLRMLPVEKPDELLQIRIGGPNLGGGESASFSYPTWKEVRDRQDVFSSAFAWSNQDHFDLGGEPAAHGANGIWVSGGFFSTLGVQAAAGRLISDSDDQPGCPAVAVLSDGFWQDHYGGAESALGGTLSLRGHPFEVIGVTPPGFYGLEVGEKSDVFLPICSRALFGGREQRLDNDNFIWLNVGGRINSQTSREVLAARLRILSARVFIPPDASAEERQALMKITLEANRIGTGTSTLRHQFSRSLQILMAVVGLVLMIACANIASLTLARAAARQKEIAVRRALGAGRMRLVRQLLTECLLLSSAGALLGILFARWSAALLVRMISTSQNPVFLNLSPDARLLAFVLTITVLAAILIGLLPALWSTRLSLTSAMKGDQSSAARRSFDLGGRKWIVASQVALSFILLMAAGLLLRSFVKLATLDIGFDRNNVLLVDVDLNSAKVPNDRYAATYDEIEGRLKALPGVLSVGRSTMTPIRGDVMMDNSVHTDWTSPKFVYKDFAGWSDHTTAFWVYMNYVSPGYLSTLRIPLLAGRNFNRADVVTSSRVAIVNQTFARRFFPNLNPIGRVFLMGVSAKPFEVVGLMEDSKYESVREEAHPTVFLLDNMMSAVNDEGSGTFELRTAIPPSAMISAVRAQLNRVNSAIQPGFHILADQVNDSLVRERLVGLLSAFFGALALLLAVIGLYGTFNYLVTQRHTEFGIRMALGAQTGSILGLVMRDVGTVLAGGLVAGIFGSLASARVVQQLLFGLGPHDAATMLGAALALSAVALVAGYLPARRATKVDPAVALRHE